MKSIKFILKNYQTKDGRTFTKASIKGKYLPLALAQEDVYYTIKFVAGSTAQMPTRDGVYEVAFDDNNMWLDNRPQVADKNIVRIKALRVVFDKPLNA